jgi:hypothetical protein
MCVALIESMKLVRRGQYYAALGDAAATDVDNGIAKMKALCKQAIQSPQSPLSNAPPSSIMNKFAFSRAPFFSPALLGNQQAIRRSPPQFAASRSLNLFIRMRVVLSGTAAAVPLSLSAFCCVPVLFCFIACKRQ